MNMPFVLSVEKVPYESKLAQLEPKLQSDWSSQTKTDLELWCGVNHVRQEWFTLNHEYRARNLYFEIRLRQRVAGKSFSCVTWQNVEVFSISLVHRSMV